MTTIRFGKIWKINIEQGYRMILMLCTRIAYVLLILFRQFPEPPYLLGNVRYFLFRRYN